VGFREGKRREACLLHVVMGFRQPVSESTDTRMSMCFSNCSAVLDQLTQLPAACLLPVGW
jgi:hypothetical protein